MLGLAFVKEKDGRHGAELNCTSGAQLGQAAPCSMKINDCSFKTFSFRWWLTQCFCVAIANLHTFFLFFIVLAAQLCPTLCDPMDGSQPDSSVHGILQTRILERVAIPFCRGSSWPRTWTGSHALKAASLPSDPPVKLYQSFTADMSLNMLFLLGLYIKGTILVSYFCIAGNRI